MKIAITTLLREDHQKTIGCIPEEFHDQVALFTRSDRVEILRKNTPSTIDIIPTSPDLGSIAQLRQHMIDVLPKGKIWMMDDSCTFSTRDPVTFKTTGWNNEKDFSALYRNVSSNLESYWQCGISPRNGNNRLETPIKEIARVYTCYGLRTDLMEQNNIRFDGLFQKYGAMLFEDFYITLKGLSLGMKNALICDFMFNYTHNSNGGNSTFRNLERQEISAKALEQEFHPFVSLEKKEGSWGNADVDMTGRTEPSIQWKKCFESGVSSKSIGESFF